MLWMCWRACHDRAGHCSTKCNYLLICNSIILLHVLFLLFLAKFAASFIDSRLDLECLISEHACMIPKPWMSLLELRLNPFLLKKAATYILTTIWQCDEVIQSLSLLTGSAYCWTFYRPDHSFRWEWAKLYFTFENSGFTVPAKRSSISMVFEVLGNLWNLGSDRAAANLGSIVSPDLVLSLLALLPAEPSSLVSLDVLAICKIASVG